MKKILLIAVAGLFAWTASAQDNNRSTRDDNYRNAVQDNRNARDNDYRNSRDNDYRNARDNDYRNARANDYRNAARNDNYSTGAQNNYGRQAGNYRGTPADYRSSVGPRVNFYTNTGDAAVGIGAYYRYSFDAHWRIEPSIYVLTEKDSSVDINLDAHYVFRISDWWGIYPQVGLVANDIKDWAFGISVGAGFDFNVARRWNLSAGLKYEPMFDSDRSNPLVVYVGAAYRF